MRSIFAAAALCVYGGTAANGELIRESSAEVFARVCVNGECQEQSHSDPLFAAALVEVPGAEPVDIWASAAHELDYGMLATRPWAHAFSSQGAPGVTAEASAEVEMRISFEDSITLLNLPSGTTLRAEWSFGGYPDIGEYVMSTSRGFGCYNNTVPCDFPVESYRPIRFGAWLSGWQSHFTNSEGLDSLSGGEGVAILRRMALFDSSGEQIQNFQYTSASGFVYSGYSGGEGAYSLFEGGQYVNVSTPEPGTLWPVGLLLAGWLLRRFTA